LNDKPIFEAHVALALGSRDIGTIAKTGLLPIADAALAPQNESVERICCGHGRLFEIDSWHANFRTLLSA